MAEACPHSLTIENKVIHLAKAGVAVKDILSAIQDMPDAPKSMGTFYKKYGLAMRVARASTTADIGNVVIKQSLDGCRVSQALYLKSKGGWSPANTVNVAEQDMDPEEDEGAVDALMALLGKLDEEDEDSLDG